MFMYLSRSLFNANCGSYLLNDFYYSVSGPKKTMYHHEFFRRDNFALSEKITLCIAQSAKVNKISQNEVVPATAVSYQQSLNQMQLHSTLPDYNLQEAIRMYGLALMNVNNADGCNGRNTASTDMVPVGSSSSPAALLNSGLNNNLYSTVGYNTSVVSPQDLQISALMNAIFPLQNVFACSSQEP